MDGECRKILEYDKGNAKVITPCAEGEGHSGPCVFLVSLLPDEKLYSGEVKEIAP